MNLSTVILGLLETGGFASWAQVDAECQYLIPPEVKRTKEMLSEEAKKKEGESKRTRRRRTRVNLGLTFSGWQDLCYHDVMNNK